MKDQADERKIWEVAPSLLLSSHRIAQGGTSGLGRSSSLVAMASEDHL